MPKGKKHGVDEVIAKLREAEVRMSQGQSQELAAKAIGVSAQTLIRWRTEYVGLRTDQAKRLKELEKENARLKRLLADAELDKAILKEAALGSFFYGSSPRFGAPGVPGDRPVTNDSAAGASASG